MELVFKNDEITTDSKLLGTRDLTIWNYMEAEELLKSTMSLRELLRQLHDPKRLTAEQKRTRLTRSCCAVSKHNKPHTDPEYFHVNGNHRTIDNTKITDSESVTSHDDCRRLGNSKTCIHCKLCKTEALERVSTKPETIQSIKKKQKNDREAILQKLSKGDPEVDSLPFGSDKPWYQPRLERSFSGNNQNLQICYINNSCSSSDNEEDKNDSKNSPSKYTSSGEMPSPALSSPGFGMRRNLPPYRMSSSSSTVSLSSTSSAGHHMSSSSLPSEGEIINIRSSPHTDEISKAITMQERLELDARKAITQAHQEARRLAEQERNKRKGSTTSLERLMRVPLDENTRQKVKTRTLTNDDCSNMTVGQLQVILNNMHADKEGMNSELMVILETRDELRTEQDAKLIDVDDMKAMLSATGPETTV